MAKGEFIKAVRQACMDAVVDLGLRKCESGIAMTEFGTEGVAGWFGLGTSARYSAHEMRVLPTVGVRWDALESLEAEIRGGKRQRLLRNAATITSPLSSLMPGKDREFVFSIEEAPEEGARDLARAVKRYGFPYMRKYSKVKSIVAAIRRDGPWEYSAPYLLLAEYLIDPDLDLKVAAQKHIDAAKRSGYDVKDFREFSRRLQTFVAKTKKVD
jgi:hypothetical protein